MATKEKQLPTLAVMQPLITATEAKEAMAMLKGVVKDLLVKDYDYGRVPGVSKDTLLKPGAEKLNKVYGLVPASIEIIASEENWDAEPPRFDYTIETILEDRSGVVQAIGLGSCNSWESKYRYRNTKRACPSCGHEDALCRSKFEDKNTKDKGFYCYDKKGGCGATFHSKDPAIVDQEVGKTENPDIADVKNTVLKMAKKRSLIDATIHATMSSELFTQDVEDFASYDNAVDVEEVKEVREEKKSEQKPAPKGSAPGNSQTGSQRASTQSKAAGQSTTKETTNQPSANTKTTPTPGVTSGSPVETRDPKSTGATSSSEQSGTTQNVSAETAARMAKLKPELQAAAKLYHAGEEAGTVPGDETRDLLLSLFVIAMGDDKEKGKIQLNMFMTNKHGIKRSNIAEKYTWAVFDDALTTAWELAKK